MIKAEMTRAHNFSAGPAVLPIQVIEETANAVLNFNNSGMSIMEVSHRAKDFDNVMKEAQSDCLKLMNLSPEEYYVMFLGGGASLQFLMVPYNFLHKKADYINTGVWSKKAIKEAKSMAGIFNCELNVAASSEDKNFNYIPTEFKFSPDADYVHLTTNNTIYGTEWKDNIPDTKGVPLIADMSSDMFAMKRDFSKYSLIYAGAQKNIGPAGVTMVVIKKQWAEENARKEVPTMLFYKTHYDNESMFNTPPCLPVFVVSRTFKWIMAQGGLEAVQKNNEMKSKLLYDAIDAHSDFYKGAVTNPKDRSLMNVTFNCVKPELEAKFIAEAKERYNMTNLKGHRSVGGIRASIYNACPVDTIKALIKFMEEFYKENK